MSMRSAMLLGAGLCALLALALVTPSAAATYPVDPPCGVVTDPGCWAPRMACQVYKPYVTGTPLEKCKDFNDTVNGDVAALRLGGLDGEGTCENYGVIIKVTGIGTNYYCEDGECTNAGLIVMIGHSESCYGEGYGTVCAAERCVVGPDGVGEVGTLQGAG